MSLYSGKPRTSAQIWQAINEFQLSRGLPVREPCPFRTSLNDPEIAAEENAWRERRIAEEKEKERARLAELRESKQAERQPRLPLDIRPAADRHADVVELARSLGKLDTATVSERLGITLNAAHGRIWRAVRAGLLIPCGRGAYSLPQSNHQPADSA